MTLDALVGRSAVVTGAASGIGFALASRFVEEGMRVVMADVDPTAPDAARRALGDSAIACVTDVADEASVNAFAQRAYDEVGEVHLLCNNAGVAGSSPASIWETPLEAWHWVLGVNLMGIIHGLRSVPRG